MFNFQSSTSSYRLRSLCLTTKVAEEIETSFFQYGLAELRGSRVSVMIALRIIKDVVTV